MTVWQRIWANRWQTLLFMAAFEGGFMGMTYKGAGVPFWSSYLADWASMPVQTVGLIWIFQRVYRFYAQKMCWSWTQHRIALLAAAFFSFTEQCLCEVLQRYVHSGILAGTYDPWDFAAFGVGFVFTALCIWRGVSIQQRKGITRPPVWKHMTPSPYYSSL
jgi:hypothetical protein